MKPVPSLNAARNEKVVGLLRGALADAEAGKFEHVILIVEYADGTTSDMWATSPGFYPAKLIGALHICLTRIVARYVPPVIEHEEG